MTMMIVFRSNVGEEEHSTEMAFTVTQTAPESAKLRV